MVKISTLIIIRIHFINKKIGFQEPSGRNTCREPDEHKVANSQAVKLVIFSVGSFDGGPNNS